MPPLDSTQDLYPDEAHLRLALDAARVCTWDWSLQTKEITWSSGYERLFGASVGTLDRTYAAFEAHVHPDDRAGIQAAISRVPQQNYQHEFRVVWSDGSVHWLEGRGKLFYDDFGVAIRLLGVVMDIGDRKQTQDAVKQTQDALELRTVTKQLEAERRVTEAALRESEERFRAAAEGSLDAFYLLQSLRGDCGRIYDFIVVDLNTRGAELISMSRSAVIGQRLHELFPVERIGALFRRFVRVVETRQVLEEEVQLALTGVNASWVRYQLVPLADGVAVSSRDISDRKRAEIALQESNRRWRSLLENVQLVVVGLDACGTIEYANPFFLKLVGYCHEDILGVDWFETFTPAAQRQQVHAIFQELTTQELHLYYQTTIVTRSGEERIIAWNNTLLRDEYGAVVGTLGIGEDITERQAVERMKQEFVSIVSHELRTPMTSIRGSLGLLASGRLGTLTSGGQRMLDVAVNNTDRLMRLVSDILDLERLESGKIRIDRQPCDAAELIQQTVKTLQVMLEQSGVKLVMAAEPMPLLVDPDRVLQVLTNLLSNAIKFSHSGGTLWLSNTQIGDEVRFQIKDQGRGIPADKLNLIFERFQQVDASDSRKHGGTGLGLAICRSIVEQHGGQIWVESRLGEGSTFWFTLPLMQE